MDPIGERRIDLNVASERELTQLPRVGVDKARRIVHHRALRRGFRDWSDFAGTPGVSEEDVEAIRSRAWIGPIPAEQPGVTHPRRTPRDAVPVRGPRLRQR
jgi:hypothetical protein